MLVNFGGEIMNFGFNDDYLGDIGRKTKSAEWKGVFRDYFQMVINNPKIGQTAIQRLYHMIISHGTTELPNGRIEYNFFKGKIFGAEQQIEDVMMYLKASSMGLDIKKRVLLLLGPPGGGKSMILSLLKKGLATYSRTTDGSLYAIAGCPIHEDPLHLIPDSKRRDVWEKYGIKIEGRLCPYCQFKLRTDWHRNLNEVPVERVYIDEEDRIGIGTFAPAEKNDMEELYGSADVRKLEQYGNEGDVRAYAFNGELHVSNRGIMEFIEVLKAKPDFLNVLLTLAEEQQFKTPRFPLQYVDEALIAHTNESEFLKFIAEKQNEAVVDRLFIVRMPYNMKYENEEKIYHYALKTKLVVKDKEVHPGAIRLASMFAIMTREHDNPLRQGMGGISPRFILNAIAIALVRTSKRRIDPEDLFRILNHQVSEYPVLSKEQRDKYLLYLEKLKEHIEEFNRVGIKDVKLEKETKGSIFDNVVFGEDD